MTPAQRLSDILHVHTNSPFLFIGAGFSRRYLGTPTWEELLRANCEKLAPYEYYYANADSKLPRCASLIAKEYAPYWWKAPEFENQRTKYKEHISSSSSPLKVSISEYISNFKLQKDPKLTDELNALRALNAEGIITTNWDCLIESLFPGYRVYIGQQSVVRETPQNIGEIFKIHGCCTQPNSLVLTEEDYMRFRDKQAYLAAKLITIFVEHPVVFIGYSVTDPNIVELLRSILKGLGTEEVQKLQRNLIFLQRSKPDRPPGVKETLLVVEDTQLPITNLVTDDFVSIYSALAESKLKLPARLLRFCKEQLYELVSAKEPSGKLCLANFDEIKDKSEIEFVVGLGVVGTQVGERGYLGVTTRDLFEYVVCDRPSLDGKRVLEQSIPALDGGKNFLPVFRYLRETNGRSFDLNASVRRLASGGRESFKSKAYGKAALRETAGKSFEWITEKISPEKAAAFIPHLPDDRIPMELLKQFCVTHLDKAFDSTYSTFFRKLICLYDYLAFGGKEHKL